MNDLNSKLDKIIRFRNRLSLEDIYMYVVEHIVDNIYNEEKFYFNMVNLTNIEILIPFLYNHYLIDKKNLRSFCINVVDKIVEKFVFVKLYDDGKFEGVEGNIINNHYISDSSKINSLIKSCSDFKNIIPDIYTGLRGYIINTNFMYTIFHPDSIFWFFLDEYSYSDLVVQMQNYMIENGIAVSMDSILNDVCFKGINSERDIKEEELFSVRFKINVPYWCCVAISAFKGWDLQDKLSNYSSYGHIEIDNFCVNNRYEICAIDNTINWI